MSMVRAEMHCHTQASKDCLLSPERLVQCCTSKGIDRVIVTDHNSIAGAVAAHRIDPQRVVVGEEIMTTRGELLAAYVQEEIPPGLSPQEAIARLREQGAFVSVAHPFDSSRKGSWREEHLLEILPLVDAVETFNSRCLRTVHNRRATEFALRLGLAGTVGSDAHTCWELGRATLALSDFSDAEGLRRAIRSAQATTRWSPPWIHLTSRYAVFRKRVQRLLDTSMSA